MTFPLYLAVLLAAALFVAKIATQYFLNRDKPLSERLTAPAVIDSTILAILLAAVLNLASNQIPNIAASVGALNGMKQDSPEYLAMVDAAKARDTVSEIRNPAVRQIMEDFLENEASSFSNAINSILEHQITIDRSNAMDFGASAFVAARQSVETTSFVSPAGWWLNADGRAYFLKNEDAIRRGVKVSRIFIYRDRTELALLQEIIEAQKRRGVIVYTIALENIPRGLNKDIIIVDDVLVGELSVDQDTRDFDKVKVNTDRETLARVKDDWKDLVRLAERR